MKKLILCVIIFSSAIIKAQNLSTIVTGTAIDPSGQVYANGTWQAAFVPPPGVAPPYLINGQPFTQNYRGNLDSTGTFTVTVADNTTIRPGGSQWAFTVCPNSTFQCSIYTATIAGVTVNITPGLQQIIKPMAGQIKPTQVNSAYLDSFMAQAVPGSLYFDTTNNVYKTWYNSTWNVISGGGGGGGGGTLLAGRGISLSTVGTVTTISKTTPSRDVSEFGVKADGKIAQCTATAGSTTIVCGGLTIADINKPAILYSVGPSDGRVDVSTMTGSGGTGGIPGRQPITFTDTTDNCSFKQVNNTATPPVLITVPAYDRMPYGWINVAANGTIAAGTPVQVNSAWAGEGCSHPPLQGTVATVTGTVTFTGGTLTYGDQPTVITAVSGNNVTVTDAPTVSGGFTMIYGTDDHDAWETACNPPAGVNPTSWGQQLTFSGTSLISHGISCRGPGLQLTGVGWGALGQNPGSSIIVYAGKGGVQPAGCTAPSNCLPHDWILELSQGGGAIVERMGFRGNTMAKPYAIMPSFGRAGSPGGNFIAQMNKFEFNWYGWGWGDAGGTQHGYQLQSCVFSAGFTGNDDFATIDHSYCYGSEVGFDSVNDQATRWHFGKILSSNNNIGYACTSGEWFDDYYTEFNRLDIMIGSPNWPGGICTSLTMNYDGESSTKSVEGSSLFNAFNLINLTGSAYLSELNPTGIGFDLQHDNGATFSLGSIKLTAMTGYIRIPKWCGTIGAVDFSGILPSQIIWSPNKDSNVCNNGQASWFHLHDVLYAPWIDINVMSGNQGNPETLNAHVTKNWTNTLLQQDNFYQNTIGSILVSSPRAPGQTDLPSPEAGTYWIGAQKYENGVACGNTLAGQPACAGTTPYRYQMTCVDGQGLETRPAYVPAGNVDNYPGVGWVHSIDANQNLIITVSGGSPTLSTTNYIVNTGQFQRGCSAYNLYGDEGSGAIGFLTSIRADEMGRSIIFTDQGQWTKNTSRVPPVTGNSGSLRVETSITIDALKNVSCLGTDVNGKIITGTCTGGGGGGPIVSPLVVPSIDGTQNLTITVPNSGGGNPTLSSSTGTINIASLFVSNLVGTGTVCLQVDALGNISRTTAPCGTGAGTATLPWSSLTAPTTDLVFSMDTHATVWTFDLYGTGTPADPGVGFILQDLSTSNPPPATGISDTRDLLFLWTQQPNTTPLEALISTVPGQSTCPTPTSCAGFKVDGATGNIQMMGNAGIQIPGTTGVVSSGSITSDTSMFSPIYNVCTAAAPCIVPALAPLNSARKDGTEVQAGRAPAPRAVGGEPLASFHLHDFSATKPTNGQVPTFNSTLGVYVPVTPTPGGGGGPPTGTAGGDLSGSYPGPQVVGLMNHPLPTLANGNLNWNGNAWNFSTSSGGGGAPTFPSKTITGPTYNVLPTDFSTCATLLYTGTAAITVQLPTPTPPNGQCIWIVNASTNSVTIGRPGSTSMNGSSSFPVLVAPAGTVAPNSIKVTSDGSNWTSSMMPANISQLYAGTFRPGTWTVGNGTVLSYTGTGTINANQLLGATIPALPTAPGGYLNYNGTAWNFAAAPSGGIVSWDQITNPFGNSYLYMGQRSTLWEWDLSTPLSGGLMIDDASSANPAQAKTMLNIGSSFPNISPLALSSGSHYFLFDGSGNVTISNLAGATSLAADSTGKIIPGAGGPGGGPVKWSDLVSPDKGLFLHLPYTTEVSFDMSNAATGWYLYEGGSQYPGSEYGRLLSIESYTDWVDPISVWGPNGGFSLNAFDSTLTLVGQTKLVGPIILTTVADGVPVANAPSLATDANGNIVPSNPNTPIYSRVFANLPMDVGTGGTYWTQMTGPECNVASRFCTMTTPTVDGTYRFTWQLIMVAAGSGGTCNAGAMLLVLQWTDPDQDVSQTPYINGRNQQGQAPIITSFPMTNTVVNGASNYTAVPIEFRAKHGQPIQFRFFQSPPSNCDIPPRITFRPALYGPLGY